MEIELTKEVEQALTASIRRYVSENMENDIGDLQSSLFLRYCLEEIGPCVYNAAIADAQRYLQEKLANTHWGQYETIVLGCTHFIYYRNMIQALAGDDIHLIDGNEGTVNHLVNIVGANRQPTQPHGQRIVFYSSGVEDPSDRANRLLDLLN